MKTYKNISVHATRTNVVRNNETKTILQQIGVEVRDTNTGKGWKIWLNAKYYEKGRLLEELKDCVERCCVDQIAGMEEGMTIESIAEKMRAGVQQCIDNNDIYTYTTKSRGGKLVEHYYYTPKNTFVCEEDKSLKERYPEEVDYILRYADALCEQEDVDFDFEGLVNIIYNFFWKNAGDYSDDTYEKKAERLGLDDLTDMWYPTTKKEIEEILDEDNDTMGYLDRHHNNTKVAEPTLFEQENQVEDTTNLDQPQANTETIKNSNHMNNNREKMMGGAVTTKTGLTINVWGLKNNMYQVKVSWRNRKASFEVEAPKKVADAIYANTADYARVSLAQYMADHLEDIRMPFLLSPYVKKSHKDHWNQNKEEWVAYGKTISMGWATLDSPHWYCYNKRTNDQTPVVVEEPQAMVEEQEQIDDTPMVAVEQEQIEDTPMVEDQPNELHAEVDNYKVSEECANSIYDVMLEYAHTYSSDLQKCLRQPLFIEMVEDRLIAYYKDFDNRSARELLETIYILKGFINAQAGDDVIDCYVAKATSKWVAAGLPLRVMTRVETIKETIKTEMSGVAGIDGVTNETIKELAGIASVSDDDDIVKLYTALSLYQVNRSGRWAKDVRKILYPTTETQEPTSEISKVPQEVEQVVEEPKVDDDEDKHWHVYISTEHNPGTDGYTHYLVNVTRWGSIGGRHKQTDPHMRLMLSFNYYPCLKDNPKENKMVKDIIKGLCMEYKHLLSPSEKYERRFSDNTKNLFEKKVAEGWETQVKQYEKVA